MKLTMSTKSLVAGLKSVIPAVAARSGLPILSGVRLGASEDGLVIEATDLELTARRTVNDVVTQTGGVAVVPAKALAKAVASMSEPEVELESTPNEERATLDVRAGTRTLTLQGWAIQDWPAIPRISEVAPVASVDAAAAADALTRAAVCASTDEARPVLGAVALFFEQDPPCVEVVATDSYRLGAVRVPLASATRVPESPLLVPARACRVLARQLKGVRGVLEIRAQQAPAEQGPGADHVGFAVAEASWTVRRIGGEFPNWRQVMPEPTGGLLEFDPDELASTLRAATSVRGAAGAPVRLTLGDACSLSVREPDVGEMREVLPGASFSPNGAGPIQVAFNPGYLADAVAFCGAERGRMWVRDGLKPVLFEGPERRHALMPVRIP
jgi:DNA polymerase-3 subunit beta